MAAAGEVVARALTAVRAAAAVGVCLQDLDQVAREVLRVAGAWSPFLGYQPSFAPVPYPGVVCLSVNDAVLHGIIPTTYRLREGDLLGVDCGATLDGWTGDAAVSFCLGPTSVDYARLLERTEHALHAGIAAARHDARTGDISAAIGAIARRAGYGLHADFGGHGVGPDEPCKRTPRPQRRPPGPRNAATHRDDDRDRTPGSWPAAATPTASMPTAGRCEVPTAPAAPTSDTPSPSPTTNPRILTQLT